MRAWCAAHEDTVAYRVWPPVAIGAPLLVGWLGHAESWVIRWTSASGGFRSAGRPPLSFVGWNGWSVWLFGRHQTGLLPGQGDAA